MHVYSYTWIQLVIQIEYIYEFHVMIYRAFEFIVDNQSRFERRFEH